MKVVIVGSSGLIAKRLGDSGIKQEHSVFFTSRKEDFSGGFLDLARAENFDYEWLKNADLILHLGAISSPDLCASDYNSAYQINVTGTKYFLERALKKGSKVLFFSSDYVYGESFENEVFDENSVIKPFGEYGKMKAEVEEEFLDHSNFKVFRLSYVFAKDDKFTSYLRECTETLTRPEVFDPLVRNVVYIEDLILAIRNLINNFDHFKPKIINVCGDAPLSRVDMANLYQKFVDPGLQYKVVNPGKDFFISRPKKILLKSLYLETLLEREPYALEKAMQMEFNKAA